MFTIFAYFLPYASYVDIHNAVKHHYLVGPYLVQKFISRKYMSTVSEHQQQNLKLLLGKFDFLSVRKEMQSDNAPDAVSELRRDCDEIKDILSETYHRLYAQLREGNPSSMTVVYVYLNLLQETQEMVSGMRKYQRSYAKLLDSNYSSRKANKYETV